MSNTINVKDYPILTNAEATEYMATMRLGNEFETPNGEMPDSMARTVASWYQSSGSVGSVLASLASGSDVARDALAEDIAATARTQNPMWPVELEYLATWLLNHE